MIRFDNLGRLCRIVDSLDELKHESVANQTKNTKEHHAKRCKHTNLEDSEDSIGSSSVLFEKNFLGYVLHDVGVFFVIVIAVVVVFVVSTNVLEFYLFSGAGIVIIVAVVSVDNDGLMSTSRCCDGSVRRLNKGGWRLLRNIDELRRLLRRKWWLLLLLWIRLMINAVLRRVRI